jgi:hypothetical protein
MSIIQLNQIKNQINNLFEGKIDLSDVTDPSPESYFLTRALSAYSIHYLAPSRIGRRSRGRDRWRARQRPGRHSLRRAGAQALCGSVEKSKWIHNGNGQPENGDVKKFIAGVHDLCNLSFDRFND